MPRMLGRWQQGGCGCQSRGPDCAGNDRSTRWRKRVEQRQTAREVGEALRDWMPGSTAFAPLIGADAAGTPNFF